MMTSLYPMKKNTSLVRVVTLIVILPIYLILGAAVFHVIERPNEMMTRDNLNRYITTFMKEHKHCVLETEVEELVEIIQSASLDGILYNGTHDRWDLVSTFFFSSTVVTTIGKKRLTLQLPPPSPTNQGHSLSTNPLPTLTTQSLSITISPRTSSNHDNNLCETTPPHQKFGLARGGVFRVRSKGLSGEMSRSYET